MSKASVQRKAAAAKKAGDGQGSKRIVASNRKARHNYSILEVFEAGVVLTGTEVKSLREGQASLADAFATVDDGEIWLRNLHIAEYHHGTWTNHAPRRKPQAAAAPAPDRHAHRPDPGRESDPGAAVDVFLRGQGQGGVGAGARQAGHDKRQDIARRDAQSEVVRELGRRVKGKI